MKMPTLSNFYENSFSGSRDDTFPAFYETGRLITAFTRVCHLFQSSARSIQYMPPSHFSKINFNIIFPPIDSEDFATVS
jgi:hypothetical protein